MKKIIFMVLACIMCFSSVACSSDKFAKEITPQTSQMKSICELATMDCYYHNVAKYFKEDVSGSLWWKKDRKFWVEYAGVVTVGIDTSLVNIEVDDENVTITIPPAKVLGCKVDEATLNDDSFIIAKNSAKVEAKHQSEAFMEAQSIMQEEASSDTVLLKDAQQKAQKLLEDYVKNIGNCEGKTYKIKWIYLDNEENPQDMSTETQ
ncbi:MAG: DUF4230 domain-containing protein [Bacillus sp. (in: firmicutes)]